MVRDGAEPDAENMAISCDYWFRRILPCQLSPTVNISRDIACVLTCLYLYSGWGRLHLQDSA